jgi:hypothetical protein
MIQSYQNIIQMTVFFLLRIFKNSTSIYFCSRDYCLRFICLYINKPFKHEQSILMRDNFKIDLVRQILKTVIEKRAI